MRFKTRSIDFSILRICAHGSQDQAQSEGTLA
jgi:hypothetical protein